MTISGTGFTDLNHGYGLACSFGSSSLVPASLSDDARTGAGTSVGTQLVCISPPLTELQEDEESSSCSPHIKPVPVRITLNGNNSIVARQDSGSSAMTRWDSVNFSYYDWTSTQ